MTPAEHDRLMQLVADAVELPHGQRDEFIRRSCDGDTSLLAEALRLLSHVDDASDILPPNAGSALLKSAALSPAAQEQIGPYRIIRIIGEGGMGAVYEAEQTNPKRRVAVKVIRRSLQTTSMKRRFEYEAQVLAQLEHPGIARLYEARTDSEDVTRPAYLVMELVDGQPIDDYVRNKQLNTRGKIELLIRVCEAIAHAHRMGILHRDLKPANILIESDGLPKVLDFGVAKAINPANDASLLTQAGQIIGTLAYMSPERIEGTQPIDTRSDVYSLGVILYKLLAGILPIDVSDQSLVTAARRICSEQPKPLGEIDRTLRGDTEIVVARALEKDVDRRYASVEAFSRDLQRLLSGLPVEARSNSRFYVYRMMAWRYRGAITVAVASIIVLCAFSIYSWGLARSNQRQSDELKLKTQEQQRLLEISKRQSEEMQAQSEERRQQLYMSNVGFAHAAINNNDVPRVLKLLDNCPPDLRNWEWNYLKSLCDQSLRTQPVPCDLVRYAEWSADHSKMIVASLANEVMLLDTDGGTVRFQRKLTDGTARVSISPAGDCIAFGGAADQLCVVDVPSMIERRVSFSPPTDATPFTRRLRAICFSPDGSLLVAVSIYGQLTLFDVRSMAIVRQFSVAPREPSSMLFTRDGRSVILGNDGGGLKRFDLATGKVQTEYVGHNAGVSCIELSADGSKLLSGDFAGNVILWSVEGGTQLNSLRMDNQWITSLALSADGKVLAVGRADAGLFLFDATSRYPLCQLRGHTRGVIRTWFDNDRIVTVGLDSQIRTWLADPALNASSIDTGQKQTLGVVFMPDSGSLFSTGTAGTIRRWDVHSLKLLQTYEGHAETTYYLAIDRFGRRLASGGRDKKLKIWDIASGGLVRSIDVPRGHVLSVAITPDGSRVLSGDIEGGIQLWDVESGKLLRTWITENRRIYSLAFHSDGTHFASCNGGGQVQLWSVDSDQPLTAEKIEAAPAYEVRFNAAGDRLACVGDNGIAKLFKLDGFTQMSPITNYAGHVGIVTGVAINPDGSRVATCGQDRTIRIWDSRTGIELVTLRGHTNLIQRLAFSPDGKVLASSSDDGTVRLWRAAPP